MSELLTRAIDHLAAGLDLSESAAAEALAEIMAGEASDIEIAGFLIALRVKGETIEELAGLAQLEQPVEHMAAAHPARQAGNDKRPPLQQCHRATGERRRRADRDERDAPAPIDRRERRPAPGGDLHGQTGDRARPPALGRAGVGRSGCP